MFQKLIVLCAATLLVSCVESTTVPRDGLRSEIQSSLGATPQASACLGCVVNQTFVRAPGTPVTETVTFAGDPAADYIIDIDDNGSQGANATLTLNGATLVTPDSVAGRSRFHVRRSASMASANTLSVRLTGKPGSTLSVSVLGGSKSVGAEGGRVRVPGGLASLDVPPGALQAPTELSIVLDPSGVPQPLVGRAATPVLRFGPDGTVFALPAVLSLTLPAGGANAGGAQLFQFIPDTTLLRYQMGAEFDPSTRMLRASLSHFSDYIAIWSTLPAQTSYYIYMLSNFPSTRGGGTPDIEVTRDVNRALGLWASYSHKVGINWARQNVSCPDVEIRWEPLGDFKGATDERPIDIQYGLPCSGKLKRIVRLNDALTWRSTDRGPAAAGEWNIVDVVSHEFGHVLGLNHPSAQKCEDYLSNGIKPASGGVLNCYQAPLMRAKGDNAAFPVLLASEDLDNLQTVYSTTGWAESSAWKITAVAGDVQTGVAIGGFVPVQPRVRVTDQGDNPVANAVVLFTALNGSSVLAVVGSTDIQGFANVLGWRLGGTAGVYSLNADINLGAWPNVPLAPQYQRAHVVFTASTPPAAVPVATVVVTPATATLVVGETMQFVATPKDANGNTLTGRIATWWWSSDGSIATVSSTGVVTGVATGIAHVIASIEANSAVVIVTVGIPPSRP